MFANAASSASPALGRRALLGFAALAVAAPILAQRALADTSQGDPTATVKRLNDALLTAMKAGKQTDFNHRYELMAPAVDQAFDLQAVLALSVGARWVSLPPDQQNRLLDAFRRYTVASYVANFDNYAGQTFTVSPAARDLGAGQVVVQSRIVPTSGSATELGYVMKQTPGGWKVVDVLADGSISRVAVQRSDFRGVLASGGGDALVATLHHKVSDLSGGALA
jgi:phospholipid transport system substrate-binding protein